MISKNSKKKNSNFYLHFTHIPLIWNKKAKNSLFYGYFLIFDLILNLQKRPLLYDCVHNPPHPTPINYLQNFTEIIVSLTEWLALVKY